MQKVKMITLETLLEMQTNEEQFTLIDVLAEDSYNKGHIPGAINMPSDSVAGEADKKLDKSATIVTYCASYACPASTIASRKLMDTGYSNVLDFKGGKASWETAGLELES